ncbi:TetR/AcrR family transcriptional regulator [Echinimonas agarilytica]|uniref:TetR/AcrR family transcriptional regulator n=1 Tax=Echinimonas agarilytica TaxID=1215918 RepID=A0AA41W6G1_9GAMM|nr:TetR/AcrR family transcriptional regulator [Echinimonas agarilytica]MCM2679532.1 TetR/AcrR family transcriptional regulator [Echinimonas agarilytica]
MPLSTDIILSTARDCFFRHGYSASNISMISRYAGISRVTIHKQFGSKEELFRAVCLAHQQSIQALLPQYQLKHDEVWVQIETMLLDWGRPLFEEIKDELVAKDLMQAASHYCEKEMSEHVNILIAHVEKMLQTAQQQRQLSFANSDMNAAQLSRCLVWSVRGLYMTASSTDASESMLALVKLYKAALRN